MRGFRSVGSRQLSLDTVADPTPEHDGDILLRPLAVGICGSDLHYLAGTSAAAFPRTQGHEFAAEVVDARSDRFRAGDRVAVLPGLVCGVCYPCTHGRRGACEKLRIIGVHYDGGLAERIVVPAGNCFPIGGLEAGLASFIEPMSVALHAVARPHAETGERAVVLGAGPIGQAITHALTVMGVSVAITDPLMSRRDLGVELGAQIALAPSDGLIDEVHEWLGGSGPELVFDTTGVASVFRSSLDLVRQCGRVVVVGLTGEDAGFRANVPVHKELDILGTSCCSEHEFAEAAMFVERHAASLAPVISHRFAFEATDEAFALAFDEPDKAMKIVIDL